MSSHHTPGTFSRYGIDVTANAYGAAAFTHDRRRALAALNAYCRATGTSLHRVTRGNPRLNTSWLHYAHHSVPATYLRTPRPIRRQFHPLRTLTAIARYQKALWALARHSRREYRAGVTTETPTYHHLNKTVIDAEANPYLPNRFLDPADQTHA